METLTNNSLKEYYVKILKMYENAVNMITAINQSLSTSSSEVSVTMINEDDTETTLRIPSMLYMENKFEQLENNFSNLFNMPESGEAWFTKSSDMYKLQLVTAGTSPVVPNIDNKNVYASITDNNFLKDLVSPKTFLKLNITNLPDNIEKIFMRKIVFNNLSAFNTIQAANYTSYDEYSAVLYNLTKGVDYVEYDSTLDVPIKCSVYNSSFKIVDVPDLDSGNPWVDATTAYANGHEHLTYQLTLDRLTYTNAEDTSIEFTLKAGDYIALNGKNAIYKVKSVNIDDMSVIIEESVGHISLQPYTENSAMEFSLYVDNYSEYHYVQVPLEEDEYIAIFLGCISNGTRSLLSAPYIVDLGSIYMYDENGNKILDSNGTHLTYIEYYNKYCTNIGDLLAGITEVCQPQLQSVTKNVLNALQSSVTIQTLVTQSVNADNVLQVVPINKHLIDNTTTEQIINLNAQKAEINSQLSALQSNIDNVYSKLISTDFSQDVTTTQESLRADLDRYYAQRTELNKQLIAVIDNINSSSDEVTVAREGTKYRVRGITNVTSLEEYLKELSSTKIELIGIECQYKYKSITKDTTSISTINSNVFTDWNRLCTIDKQRRLSFNESGSSYSINYVDYGTTQNIIKWNQIDIPITHGEDVVVRVRYKYNIGQPFINLYSPWSNEMTIVFPAEYDANSEMNTILATNENDAISARFMQTLITNGYEEHVNNSITVNNNTFYHMPENIYSGFNTAENNYISLRDKLTSMSNDIDIAKDLINNELNKKYTVYLQYDSTVVELFNNSVNKINIYNNDHISDSFVKKEMYLIIKNTGDVNVKFYSIFPGNIDVPLLLSNDEFYEQYIQHYERVPLFISNKLEAQTLGQWIYFRQDNPYTGQSIYNNNEAQNLQDYRAIVNNSDNLVFTSVNTYMKDDYKQCLLGYRRRTTGEITTINQTLVGLDFSSGTCEQLVNLAQNNGSELNEAYANKTIEFFKYLKDTSNNYLNRFEDICGTGKDDKIVYLDSETSMSEFISDYTVSGLTSGTGTFIGAFFYPNIDIRSSILTSGAYNSYKELEVGKSISIPLTFEYYIDGETVKEITKAVYFDLRDSLLQNPVHYMLELTANYDYTATGNLINNTSLQDEATL